MVSAGLEYSTAESVVHALLIAVNGYNIYSKGKSQYYYMSTGSYMGKFFMEIFVSADAWAQSGIITPTKPWILYDAQVPDAADSTATTTSTIATISDDAQAEAAEAEAEALALAGADATADSLII